MEVAAKSLQSCPTLCEPIDGSPLGSPVPGILQARTLEWVAISFSNAWKWKVKVKSLSHIQLVATPWTAAYQAPPPMGFSRQEYWSGVPLPSPILGLPAVLLQECLGIKELGKDHLARDVQVWCELELPSRSHLWVRKISWRRKWQPTPAFLPGESQRRGSLVGCRLWGCTESDMTEVT